MLKRKDYAREIAHRHCPRCTGGQEMHVPCGGDRVRYHSKACDRLTEDIVTVIIKAIEGEFEP